MSDLPALDYSDLLVPVYTDADNALSLVATLEGGLDLARTITSEHNAKVRRERGLDGELGASGLPILRVGAKGKLGRTVENEDKHHVATENIDTLGSLLHRLRAHLQEAHLIPMPNQSPNYKALEAGAFVEFFGTFRENPLPSALNTAERLLNLIETVMKDPRTSLGKAKAVSGGGQKPKQNGQGKHGGGQDISLNPLFSRFAPNMDVDEVEKYLPLLPALRQQLLAPIQSDLTTGVSRTYIVQGFNTNYHAVLTLLDDFVRNLDANEIDGHEFRILGKVVRHVIDDSDGVQLMRGSSLALFEKQLQPLLEQAVRKFNLPPIRTTVTGPVLEILPIAVYV